MFPELTQQFHMYIQVCVKPRFETVLQIETDDYMRTYNYIYVCIHMHMYLQIYIHMFIYIYIYIYVYVYLYLSYKCPLVS